MERGVLERVTRGDRKGLRRKFTRRIFHISMLDELEVMTVQ